MDKARRIVAILLMATTPPAIVYWYAVHPFSSFWQRIGVRRTFVILICGMVVSIVLLFLVRDPLLGRDLGTSWPLAIAGILLYLLAGYLELRVRRHLTFRTLAGVPEVAMESAQGKLLDKGIYSRVRHPRYVLFLIAIAGFAMFSNYVGMYVLALLCVPAIVLVARLEERELVERFGSRYEEYRQKVPAFIPRRRGRHSGTGSA